MDWLKSVWDNAAGIGAVLAVGAGMAVALRALRYLGPAYVVGKVRAAFDRLRASAWLRRADRPTRRRLFIATLAWLEEELPEPGTGKEFYDAAGTGIAGAWLPLKGTGPGWARALEAIGDAVDTELDTDIKRLEAGE